ncbi:MAG: CrcB family protein [Acidimicrobiia bacterium]
MSTARNRQSKYRTALGLARRVPLRWRRRIVVVVGGAAGSIARLAVTDIIPLIGGWPFGTLVVNLTGSFALGWLIVRLTGGARPLTLTVPLLGVGLLGGFTTFGTFALELWMLGTAGRWVVAVGYGVVSVVPGLACAVLGARLGGRA